jgi:voltage-gated potassium channel
VPDQKNLSPSYQLFMLVLCLYSLGALAAQVVVRVDPEIRTILEYSDNAVCVIFFADFLFSLFRAPDRRRYLVTWGWLDLVSSIPALEVARWGRIARVVRVFRVLRGLRATKLLTSVVLRHRAQNAFLAASLVALLLIVFCSVAALQFETHPDSNIVTGEDALWWAFATITTVGYGDRYPVTAEGRFIAAILMTAGVGLFGTFSGFLAAWFLAPEEDETGDELALLRREIADLRELITSRIESEPRTR